LGNLGGEKTLTQNVALNISDSLHALKILSTHPHIDSDRIFNVGWSLGGVVAVDGAFPALSRYILPEGMHWAGSVGMYGGCNIKWRADHLGTNYSPVLMLLGEIDDNTPASYCVDYARNLAREGHKVTYKVYPGAGHDFDRYEENPIKFRHGIFSSCDVEVKMSLEAGGPGTGYDFVQKKSLTSWDDVGSSITACQKMANVTIAGQRKAREQSVKDVLEFINVTTKR
jgi:dienelactone hydrolase